MALPTISVKQTTTPAPRSNRVMKIYCIAAIETSLLIFSVFAQPMYSRLFQNNWIRYGTLLDWTLSLDVHVLVSVVFLLMMMLQVALGMLHASGSALGRWHRTTGKILLGYSLIFFAATIWNVWDRVPIVLLQLNFYIVIAGLAAYFIRGLFAIRRKDYSTHIDSMIGAFVLTGVAASARLIYFLYYVFMGTIPISPLWLLITSSILYFKLFLIYGLAGRLKQNWKMITIQFGLILLIYASLPWPSD